MTSSTNPLDYGWWLASRAAGVTSMVLVSLSVLLGLAMAGLAILAVMVSLELSRRLNTPLDRLRSATQDIAAGNFDHRVADGAAAARFLNLVREYVEEPSLWMFE